MMDQAVPSSPRPPIVPPLVPILAGLAGLLFLAVATPLDALAVLRVAVGVPLLALAITPSLVARFEARAALVFVGLFIIVGALPPAALRSWPFYLLLPLAGVVAVALFSKTRPADALGLAPGRLDRSVAILVVIFGLLAAVALPVWAILFKPDLSRPLSLIPDVSPLLLLLVGLGFSIVNALLEEIAWRGILQRWLLTFMAPPLAIAIQALSFGAAHWTGVPGGWAGIVLSTIFGLMMGVLAYRAKGLLAPILAHILADMVIFAMVLGLI